MRPYLLSLLRLVAGFMFSLHGAQKLLGMFHGVGGSGAKVQLASMLGAAGVLELAGGLLIMFGLFTRPVAFLLSGEMAFAYFRAHFPRGFWPIQNGGELAALYSFIFLYLTAAGPGTWSLDRLLRKKSV